MTSIHKRMPLLLQSMFLLIAVTSASASSERCETLKTSLTYTQENAPQDISGVVSLYYITLYYIIMDYSLIHIMVTFIASDRTEPALILILILILILM